MAIAVREPNAYAHAVTKPCAITRNLAELPWIQYHGHFHQALSKTIVTPDTVGSRFFDHGYEAGAYVESRSHKVQQQIYHVLAGGGILTVDGERRLIRVNNITNIPPGVVHEFHNPESAR